MENINWFQVKRAYREGSFINPEIIKELLKKKESKKEKGIYFLLQIDITTDGVG